MGMNMTYIDPILKEFYGVAIQESLNNEVLLKKYLETSSKKFDGRRVVFPAHYGRNWGIGARAEASALPSAGYQAFESVYVTAAYNYARIDLSGQAVEASDKTAFAQAIAVEMEGAKTDLAFDLGRQAYGEGLGILSIIGLDSCATSISVKNQYWNPGHPGARYVHTNQYIDVGTIANPDVLTSATGARVVSVTVQNNSAAGSQCDVITISASIDTITACGHFVFNNNAGGTGLELKGLRAIIDDTTQTNIYGTTGGYFNATTIFNIDRDSDGVTTWNAHVDANSGTERILDSYLQQKTMSQIKKKSGKDCDLMYGEYDVIDAFLDSVQNDRRYSTKNFDAGHEAVTFNGKMMIRDLLAPYNELYFINKDALKWYEMLPVQFDDKSGILKNVAGYDKAEAFLKTYLQLGPGEYCAPNGNGCIRDIKTNLS